MKKRDIEKRILAGVLNKRDRIDPFIQLLTEEDFSEEDQHRRIAKMILDIGTKLNKTRMTVYAEKHLISKQKIADFQRLGKAEPLLREEWDFMIEELKTTNDKAKVAIYARDLEELANNEITDSSELYHKLTEARALIVPSQFKVGNHISLVGTQFLASLHNEVDKIPSGWTEMDATMGGFVLGEYGVVAARPGIGKTTWALSTMMHVAEMGYPTAWYGFEMSGTKMYEKMISQYAKVPYFILERKNRNRIPEFENHLIASKLEIDAMPIHMFDQGDAPNMKTLRESVVEMSRRHGLKMVVVDYLQRIQVPGMEKDDVARVSLISQELKNIAAECNVFILAVTQMSRQWTIDQEDRMPRASDLRGSGQIEQDASFIAFLMRRNYGKEFKASGMKHNFHLPFRESYLWIDKNRYGTTGGEFELRSLAYIPNYSYYTNALWLPNEPGIRDAYHGCPGCNSEDVEFKRGVLTCHSCGYSSVHKDKNVRSGLTFDCESVNIFGKEAKYHYAFLQDGYQGDSIIKNVKKINRIIKKSDTGQPIRLIETEGVRSIEEIVFDEVNKHEEQDDFDLD